MLGEVAPVVRRLLDVLGPAAVAVGQEVSARARNYWDPSPLEALAIVTPSSTSEVSTALRICHEHSQSVVTHGGLTGVCGGDRATSRDIVLSLARMSAIEEIDPVGRTVRVQAGCVLERLQQAVEGQGLYLPLDLGARGSCTIGGNIATNAGGINVIRYGMARACVLGLEAVLANGTVVTSLNRMIKNNAGYDLKHLFIGTEGTLGVVTRAVLSLKERTASEHTALVGLATGEQVAGLLKHADRGLAGTLTSFELMWGEYFRGVTGPEGHSAPCSRDYPFYVLLEARGGDPETDAQRFQAVMERALEQGLAIDVVLPKSRRERDHLWKIREHFEPILGFKPQFLYDVSLPLRDMFAYVAEIQAALDRRWPGNRFHALGHIGDGNLHFFVSPGRDEPGLHEAVDEVIYAPLARYGGSISAEHGIGVEKKGWLHVSRTPEEIELMRALKQTLDPRGILNPGKIFDPVS